MNWYKRASHNVRFPPNQEIENSALEIAKSIITDWSILLQSGKNQIWGGKMDFINPYTGKLENPQIIISRRNQKATKTVCEYSYASNVIYIYPEHFIDTGLVSTLNDAKMPEILASYIVHEITHTIDPKMNVNNNFDGRDKRTQIGQQQAQGNMTPYYNFPPEIDAFSKQVSYDVVQFYRQNPGPVTYKNIHDWLQNNNFSVVPNFLSEQKYSNVFYNWSQNPQIKNRINQRIYYDVQQEKTQQEKKNVQ